MVALIAVIVAQALSTRTTLRTQERQNEIVSGLGSIEERVTQLGVAQRAYVTTGAAASLERIRQIEATFGRELAGLRSRLRPGDTASRASLEAIATNMRVYVDTWIAQLVAMREQGRDDALRLVATGEGDRRVAAIQDQIHEFVEVQSMAESAAESALDRKLTSLFVLVGLVLLAMLAGCLVTVRYLRRRIVAPIVQVAGVADAIAAGDHEARVGDVGRAEVARLAHAVDQMAGSVAAGKRVLSQRNAELEDEKRTAERERSVTDAVLAATPAAICLIDASGAVVIANASVQDVPVEALSDLPVDRPGADEFDDLANGRHFRRFVASVQLPDDSEASTIVVIDDITRERSAERLKSDLIATVSHELRTPLAAVLGYSEVLGYRDLDPEKRREYARTINREAGRLSRLVSDLLDLERIEHGAAALTLEEVDLAGVLREQVALFAAEPGHNELTLVGADQAVEVWGVRDRLGQVVANLITNAIRYSAATGTIAVTLRIDDGRAVVSVSDEGIGIADADKARVFDRFFRVNSPDVAAVRGSGLGLNVAQEILASHGSTLSLESELGVGSTFSFELTLVDAAVPAA